MQQEQRAAPFRAAGHEEHRELGECQSDPGRRARGREYEGCDEPDSEYCKNPAYEGQSQFGFALHARGEKCDQPIAVNEREDEPRSVGEPCRPNPIASRIDALSCVPRSEGRDGYEEVEDEQERSEDDVGTGKYEGCAVNEGSDAADDKQQVESECAVSPANRERERTGNSQGEQRPNGPLDVAKACQANGSDRCRDAPTQNRILNASPSHDGEHGGALSAEVNRLAWEVLRGEERGRRW